MLGCYRRFHAGAAVRLDLRQLLRMSFTIEKGPDPPVWIAGQVRDRFALSPMWFEVTSDDGFIDPVDDLVDVVSWCFHDPKVTSGFHSVNG